MLGPSHCIPFFILKYPNDCLYCSVRTTRYNWRGPLGVVNDAYEQLQDYRIEWPIRRILLTVAKD